MSFWKWSENEGTSETLKQILKTVLWLNILYWQDGCLSFEQLTSALQPVKISLYICQNKRDWNSWKVFIKNTSVYESSTTSLAVLKQNIKEIRNGLGLLHRFMHPNGFTEEPNIPSRGDIVKNGPILHLIRKQKHCLKTRAGQNQRLSIRWRNADLRESSHF